MGEAKQEATGAAAETVPDDERGRLRRNIAVTLAALVVLGAGLAILQVDASANESNTAREATRTAVRGMRANVLSNTVAGLEPDLQSERDFLSFRRPLDRGASSLATAAGLPPEPTSASDDQRIARQVPDLGVRDLLSRLETDAQRLTLKQRALATTRITWNDRSTQYTTVIAVLAVALFLVGFGLVTTGPIRGSAYSLGLAIGIFAAVWGAWIYHLPIPSTPDAAIQRTAHGAVLAANGDYRTAVARYGAALRADDGYAPAYVGRARARLLEANPDYPVTRAVTDLGGGSVADAVRDARKAREIDSRDNLSALLLAVTSFYDGDYEAAERATADAIAINQRVPDAWLLRSAAQVALGQPAAAELSLERAVAPLRDVEPSQRTRLLSSTYLSYLAWVEHDVPRRSVAARRLADRTVRLETGFTLGRTVSGSPPARGSVTIQGLRYAAGRLTLRLRWSNLPRRTALSAIGYERPLLDGAWTQPPDLALFAAVSGSGTREISVPLRRACKPTAVRVDTYLDGGRTTSRTGPGVAPTC